MASSGSFERGGKPRSVPDADKHAYDAASQWQRERNAQQATQANAQKDLWDTHPGVIESFVPVWGSAREAVADYREGDMVGAAANGALAIADLTGEGFVLKKLGEGGLKVVGSNSWRATSKWMRKDGRNYLAKGQDGHHWAVPQNGWGKYIPDIVKNQPWNVQPMPTKVVHARVRGSAGGQPRFNALERYLYGTPDWWKVQNAIFAAHAAVGAEEGANPQARDDHPPPAPRTS